ncbi:MAG TPA: hypothetical protein VK472_02825 [Allosphingosinicella sp.]|nr:hypothetical protein [Allosphingosinicella sp.]
MSAFSAFLEPIFARLPAALAGEATRRRMLATAALLPGGFAFQTYGFECPLHDSEPKADILVSAVRARGGAALLASVGERPGWEPVSLLAARLGSEPAAIDEVWLEFDLDGPAPDLPNLFCRPLYPIGDLDALRASAGSAAAVLAGVTIPETLIDAVIRSAAALPERAEIFQIGAMRARPSAGLRICVNQIALDDILTALDAMDYPDVEGVRALLIRYQSAVGDVALAIDLMPELGAKIGLECYFAPSRSGRSAEELLERFLSRLGEDGACTAEKAEALRLYPGSVAVGEEGGWPPELLTTGKLLGREKMGRFDLGIHHIKLVHRPNGKLEAKAYLAVRHSI